MVNHTLALSGRSEYGKVLFAFKRAWHMFPFIYFPCEKMGIHELLFLHLQLHKSALQMFKRLSHGLKLLVISLHRTLLGLHFNSNESFRCLFFLEVFVRLMIVDRDPIFIFFKDHLEFKCLRKENDCKFLWIYLLAESTFPSSNHIPTISSKSFHTAHGTMFKLYRLKFGSLNHNTLQKISRIMMDMSRRNG